LQDEPVRVTARVSNGSEGDILVLDPTRVTDGIELSGDPILRFRPEANSASVVRRSG
jgi:catalase